MHYQNNLVLLLLSGLVAQQVQAVDRTVNATLDASLITAATQFENEHLVRAGRLDFRLYQTAALCHESW